MGTLVMLHGLTGTPEMTSTFGRNPSVPRLEPLLPEGPFSHPERGSGCGFEMRPPETPT